MFWDGYRWLKELTRGSGRTKATTSNPWATWIGTGLMLVLLVGIGVPIYRADADAVTLAISPAEGRADTRVTARIEGISAGTALVLLWDGEPVQSAQVADNSGKLSIRFAVPQDSPGIKQLALITTTATRDREMPQQLAMAPGTLLASAAFSLLPTEAPSTTTTERAASSFSLLPTEATATATATATPEPAASTPLATAAPTPPPATTQPIINPTPAPTLAPTPLPTAPPPPSTSCTVTFGGDASGATDATAALQSFFQQAPAGATACLAASGQYRVDGRVNVHSRENGLTIDGNGARLFATVRSNQALLKFAWGANLVVRNLTIEGVNPNGRTSNAHEYAWEFGMGVSLYGVVNATIDNVRILNVNGDGIYVDGGDAGAGYRWSDGVTIRNVLIDGTGRHGVAFTNGVRNAVVSGSTVRNTGMYPFVIEPDGNVFNGEVAGADGITITGNAISRYTIDSSWGPYLFAATGNGPQNDIEFSNNAVYGQNLHVAVQPNGYARTNIRILNNRSDVRVPGPVMEFAGCNYLTVTGNTQLLSSGQLATLSGCSNVTISNNTIN